MASKLRAPTKAERAAGLPTSKAEAVELGLSRFIPDDGVERVIRKYGTERYPTGSVETAESRKSNRGGGTDGSRKQHERRVTPDDDTRRAADRHMAKAASKGQVSHHGLPVAKLSEGEKAKPGTVKAYEKVWGKGNVGHSPGALYDLDHADHDYIHHKQEPAMNRSMERAGNNPTVLQLLESQVKGKLLGQDIPVIDERSLGLKVADIATNLPGVSQAKEMVRSANPQLNEQQDLDNTKSEIQTFLSNPINEIRWGIKQLQQGM